MTTYHVSYYHHCVSVVACEIFTFHNLLLHNHCANWNQTWQEYSVDDPLKSLFIMGNPHTEQEVQRCRKLCFLLLYDEHIFFNQL